MMPKGLLLFLGAMFLALADTSWGQKPWRVYKMADGLPEPACSSVTIGGQGKVLVKHLNSPLISELDGYNLRVISAPKQIQSRVYQSPSGQFWTAVREGLLEYKDGLWVMHIVPEIAAEFKAGLDPVPLYPVRQGLVIFLLPTRLMELSSEDPDHTRTRVMRAVDQTELERFSGLILAQDGGLWVAGARGLAKVPGPARNLKPESPWREFVPPASLQVRNLQQPHESEDGRITALAESLPNHQMLVVQFDGQRWSTAGANLEKIRHAWRGPDNTCWAMTTNSLFQSTEGSSEFIENEDLSARQYYDVAIEPSGKFWLATSDGLYHYAPLTWRSPAAVRKIDSLVRGLTGDNEERLWFISSTGLHALENEQLTDYPFPARTGLRLQTTRGLFPLKNGLFVLDAGDQWFTFQPATKVFAAFNSKDQPKSLKILGTLKDGSLCVETAATKSSETNYHLEIYDGARFEPFPNPPPKTVGEALLLLFVTQNGDLWLSGELGTEWYHDKKWQTFVAADRTMPEAPLGFTELADGRLWCATQDRIWEFNVDSRNWVSIRTGFDRINALLRTRDGSIWVASNSGMHRYVLGSWIENGIEEGLPGASAREIYEDHRGVWVGTTHGLSLYHPEADPPSDPPLTRIQELRDLEKNIPEGGTVPLTFSGQDRWKFTAPERLLYSYRLDDGEWSQFRDENSVVFPDLHAGNHVFQVRAMDRNCNIEPKPPRLEFAIVLPWYKETRLVLISCAGVAVALFFAGLAFNRHRQLLRSYAEVERKIDERTRELEVANRQLLHSQKMTALGTLAAGIAHDFNNILSIVQGSAQIIEDNLENPQKVRTRVDRIKTVVGQGAGIVKAMLGFSRDSDESPGQCDLNAVVEETIKLLGDRFLHEVQVRFDRGASLPPVLASKDFIQQILLNFIFNAAEAMPKQPHVVLTTRVMENLPLELVLKPALAAAYTCVSVEDFGCGISPENMARIFEPFFTTKAFSARRGTGLGLSMVYELARKMQAGLAAESVVDRGSKFTLILPVCQPQAGPESPI